MISAQRATTCHDTVCCDEVLSADPRNSYFSEQRLPLIVAIEFEDIAMFSDPWSDLITSRTVCKKNRFSTIFSDKDKTHRSVSGIPFNLGAAISIAERYALRLCCDNGRT